MINTKKTFSLFKLTLLVSLNMMSLVHSQTIGNNEPRFKTFYNGQGITAITSDANKNVWAGTTSQGIYFLNQAQSTPTFVTQSLGTGPVIGNTRILSMAKDNSGNIWIGHGGINSSNGQGGLEKVNVNTLDVQHFSPDRNTKGFEFLQRDGIATLNVQQVFVDPNNKVWTAHRYHDLTVSGMDPIIDPITGQVIYLPGAYILTPGAFSSRNANDSGSFMSFNTWRDVQQNTMIGGMPYPAYTYNPTFSQTAQSRTCNAIAADRSFVYVSVFGYGHLDDTNTYINNKPRIIKYTNTPNPQFVEEITRQDARFSITSGIFNGIYANGSNGVWVTTQSSGNGFSVFFNGNWYNINHPSIIPPGTTFNKSAIWGDSNGRVYLGTNNGLLVYDGFGNPALTESYTLYSKTPYNSPRCIVDENILSNNIIAGSIESDETENFSWIATTEGIMRSNLPTGNIYVYHVKDKELPFREKINDNTNYVKFTTLESTHFSLYPGYDTKTPSFAVDGTKSSVLRLKTDDPEGYYNPNTLYRIVFRKNTSEELSGDRNNPEYIARYGKFTLKPIEDYEGQPQIQDLKYVDFIYQHPTYIKDDDFEENKHFTRYDVFVFKRTPQQTDEVIFRHPIKFCLPPLLLGHGVWSNVASLKKFEDFIKTKGYTENETLKAWRLNEKMAENHFYRDAHIIPTYIKTLINKSLDAKVSAGKVNMIVHSRGGLYTRAYIEELKPDIEYKNDINAIVTLNTPHFGSQAANGILDKRILLTSLQRTISVSPVATFSNLIDEITFGPTEPLRIGDIFSLASPELDRIDKYGAKNLTIENDYLSGGLDVSTWFIPKLNSYQYRKKLEGIPIHAVATNFSICDLDPLLCNPSLFQNNLLIKVSKKLVWIKVLESSAKFALNTVPSGTDNFLNYIYNGPSDGIVPRMSMRAGLDDQYISSFTGLNVCHVDTGDILNSSGVTTNPIIQAAVFEKFKQRFTNSNSNFTLQGITNPPTLNYTFLAGFQGQNLLKNSINNNASKIVINPSSFLPSLTSGETVSFDVYQENIDKIILQIDSDKEAISSYFIEKEANLLFKNTFSFQIPNTIFGKIKIKAIGFKEGKMVAEHELEKEINLPNTITLQSIRFAETEVLISEKNQHQFKLLGLFSDAIEREINDIDGITYTVEYPMVISVQNSEILATNIAGQSKLTVQIGNLSAIANYLVEEDITYKQTIITDYYAEYEPSGSIELKWKSLIEYDSNIFTLEKSTDNIVFVALNEQNAQGISYEILNYSFSDNTTDNLVYYRLKLFDIYNNVIFEKTIEVNRNPLLNETFKNNIKNNINLYPNPLNGNYFTILFDKEVSKPSVTIYNMNGSEIFTLDKLEINDKKATINLPYKLSEGIYLVQIRTNEFIRTEKLIISN